MRKLIVFLLFLSVFSPAADDSDLCRQLVANFSGEIEVVASLVVQQQIALVNGEGNFLSSLLDDEIKARYEDLRRKGIASLTLDEEITKLVTKSRGLQPPSRQSEASPRSATVQLIDSSLQKKLELARKTISEIKLRDRIYESVWKDATFDSGRLSSDYFAGLIYATQYREQIDIPYNLKPQFTAEKMKEANSDDLLTRTIVSLGSLEILSDYYSAMGRDIQNDMKTDLQHLIQWGAIKMLRDIYEIHEEWLEPLKFDPVMAALRMSRGSSEVIDLLNQKGVRLISPHLDEAARHDRYEAIVALLRNGVEESRTFRDWLNVRVRDHHLDSLQQLKKNGFSFKDRPLISYLLEEVLPSKTASNLGAAFYREVLESSDPTKVGHVAPGHSFFQDWKPVYDFLKANGAK